MAPGSLSFSSSSWKPLTSGNYARARVLCGFARKLELTWCWFVCLGCLRNEREGGAEMRVLEAAPDTGLKKSARE
eukprot:4852910-Pyramimonas_sp.AAC.1